jgi:hypothetical protein
MMRRWLLVCAAAVVALVFVQGGAVEAETRTCSTLTCAKCTSICKASCDADVKACEAKGERNCPRNYRSCTRGCPSMLCAQCLPVQFGSDGRKFLPGKTELCRTPGSYEAKKG